MRRDIAQTETPHGAGIAFARVRRVSRPEQAGAGEPPLKLAQAKLADLRRKGRNPGWDSDAREKRQVSKAEALRKRAPAMTPEQRRARRASQAREYRKRRMERAHVAETSIT